MGPELMEQMRNQAARCGAELRSEDVDEVSLAGEVKTVVANGVTYRARAVILAMGAAARYLGVLADAAEAAGAPADYVDDLRTRPCSGITG